MPAFDGAPPPTKLHPQHVCAIQTGTPSLTPGTPGSFGLPRRTAGPRASARGCYRLRSRRCSSIDTSTLCPFTRSTPDLSATMSIGLPGVGGLPGEFSVRLREAKERLSDLIKTTVDALERAVPEIERLYVVLQADVIT